MTTGRLFQNSLARLGRVRQVLKGSKTRRATLGSVTSGVASQGVLIVSGVLAARILGVEGRGYLAILTVFVSIVAFVGGLGIPRAVTFYISKTRRARAILRQLRPVMLTQAVVLTVVHLTVVFVYIQGEVDAVKNAALYTLIATPGVLANFYGLAILQGQERFRLFNLLRLLPVASYTVMLMILFVADQGKLPSVAVVWSASNLFAGLSILFLAYSGLGDDISKSDKDPLPTRKRMAHFGLKGLFGWASPLDSFRIDHLIAGLVLSTGALGLYVVGQAFTNIPKFISQSIGMVAYPTISGKDVNQDLRRLIRRFILAVTSVNVLIVVILWLAMPLLIEFFFGDAFMGSIPLARILIIGALIVSLRRIIVECVCGLGRPEISTYAEVSMYPWLILAIPVLIIPFGITGMAVSVVLGQLLSLIVTIILTARMWPRLVHAPTRATATEGDR